MPHGQILKMKTIKDMTVKVKASSDNSKKLEGAFEFLANHLLKKANEKIQNKKDLQNG